MLKIFFVVSLLGIALVTSPVVARIGENETENENDRPSTITNITVSVTPGTDDSVREDFKKRNIEDLKENRLQLKEAREELKNKFREIKSERKKKTVEKFVGNMSTAVLRLAAEMRARLTRISQSLATLETAIVQAKAGGKDTAKAETDLALAKSSHFLAQAAVAEFAAKDYTPVLSVESALSKDLQTSRNAFGADVAALQKKLKAAKEAATKVLVDVKQLRLKTRPTLTPTPVESP